MSVEPLHSGSRLGPRPDFRLRAPRKIPAGRSQPDVLTSGWFVCLRESTQLSALPNRPGTVPGGSHSWSRVVYVAATTIKIGRSKQSVALFSFPEGCADSVDISR